VSQNENLGRCSARVYAGSFTGHPCTRNAKVLREGKPYCGTHDPVAIADKRKAKHAQWDQEAKEKGIRWAAEEKRRKAIQQLCGHIPTDELDQYELVRKAGDSQQ